MTEEKVIDIANKIRGYKLNSSLGEPIRLSGILLSDKRSNGRLKPIFYFESCPSVVIFGRSVIVSSFDYKKLANHGLLRTSKAIPAGTDQAAAADHVSESLYELTQIAAAAKLEQVSIFLKYAYYEAVKARAEITGESRDDIQPQTESCPDYAEVPEDY